MNFDFRTHSPTQPTGKNAARPIEAHWRRQATKLLLADIGVRRKHALAAQLDAAPAGASNFDA